jgi:hypothetical protein
MGKYQELSLEVEYVTDSIQTPILQRKWAKYGVAGDYDKRLLAWYGLDLSHLGLRTS